MLLPKHVHSDQNVNTTYDIDIDVESIK